jgi:t-SNARE complex subunit (syntaxin)
VFSLFCFNKTQALEIGEEIKIQNVVLDSLDMHVDIATEGLKEETKHAEEVRIKGQVCYMYICIVIEVVIILIMAFLFFKL